MTESIDLEERKLKYGEKPLRVGSEESSEQSWTIGGEWRESLGEVLSVD